jgi:hypothetical protein
MQYGLVDELLVYDDGSSLVDRQTVHVKVDFIVDRSILFEFMDALRPIDQRAQREPIAAILEHSAEPRAAVEP